MFLPDGRDDHEIDDDRDDREGHVQDDDHGPASQVVGQPGPLHGDVGEGADVDVHGEVGDSGREDTAAVLAVGHIRPD